MSDTDVGIGAPPSPPERKISPRLCKEAELFYQLYRPTLLRYLAFLGVEFHTADEVISNTILIMLRKWGDIGDPPAYARRVAFSQLRQLRIDSRKFVLYGVHVEDVPAEAGHLGDCGIWEQQEWVDGLLASLTNDQRAVLELVLQDHSRIEIAHMLGATEDGVRQSLARARNRILKLLAEENPAEVARRQQQKHGQQRRGGRS